MTQKKDEMMCANKVVIEQLKKRRRSRRRSSVSCPHFPNALYALHPLLLRDEYFFLLRNGQLVWVLRVLDSVILAPLLGL